MNILMVTMQMHIGGAETHILELCRELHRRGHHVTLVSNGGVYADMLAAEGIEQVILPFHTKTPAAVVKAMRGLEQCIRAGNRWGDYEILHAHARIPAWISGLLWDRFRKHPIIREGRQVPLFRFVTTAESIIRANRKSILLNSAIMLSPERKWILSGKFRILISRRSPKESSLLPFLPAWRPFRNLPSMIAGD